MSFKKINLKTLSLIAVSALSLALGLYTGVQAAGYVGTVYGRKAYHGYFTNNVDYNGVAVLPVISNGQAIPNNVNTVSELISLLKNANHSGNTQRVTGSAFIVNTMLNRDAPGIGGRSVSDADFTKLSINLKNNATIKWDVNINENVNSYYQGSSNDDDAFYSDPRSESGIKIYDKSTGKLAYEILRRCANPMGNNPGSIAAVWHITPKVSVNKILDSAGNDTGSKTNAVPTDTIYWTHTVTNTGLDFTDRAFYYDYLNGTYLSPSNGNGSDINVAAGMGPGASRSSSLDYSKYLVATSDVGRDICRATRAKPWAWDWDSSDGWRVSSYACVHIDPAPPSNPVYELTPRVTVNPKVIEPGATLSVTSYVNNTGPDASGDTTWALTRQVNSNTPTSVSSGSSVYQSGDTAGPGTTDNNTSSLNVGDAVCFILTLTPHSSSDTGPISAKACVVIAKKPKVQFLGADLNVIGGSVVTSTSFKNNHTFGSWAQYGIVASGGISGAASGAAYDGPGGGGLPGVATVANSAALSFANAGNHTNCNAGQPVDSNYVGCYNNANTSALISGTVGDMFPSSKLPSKMPPSNSVSTWASGTYNVGNLALAAGNLSPGRSIVIKSSGTVTLNGDQTYDNGPYSSISQLPQLIIIAKSIVINHSVSQVDAWLVALDNGNGSIMTCDSPRGSVQACNNSLTINGPVMTDKLYLDRTAGSGNGPTSGDPAEVINLRPDAYLWAQAQMPSGGRYETVYLTELPPRV